MKVVNKTVKIILQDVSPSQHMLDELAYAACFKKVATKLEVSVSCKLAVFNQEAK
jgi:hypothetical protein